MTNPFQSPGLHTDTANPRDPVTMYQRGFRWIVQQAQNDYLLKSVDLTAYRKAGFKTGVWGVSYREGDFERDGANLVTLTTDSDLMVMNVEFPHNPDKLIAACSKFSGPKALITLVGILHNIAVERYIAAGWQIIGETYTNDQEHLTPALAEWYASQAGIPRGSFSHALGMYYGLEGWVTGEHYAALLRAAGAGPRFSCWMVEQGAEESYAALGNYVQSVQEVQMTKEELKKIVEELESSIPYKSGWGKVVRPTRALRAKLNAS